MAPTALFVFTRAQIHNTAATRAAHVPATKKPGADDIEEMQVGVAEQRCSGEKDRHQLRYGKG